MLRHSSELAVLAVLVGPATAAWAQAPQARPPVAAASSFASTEVHINARKISGQWYLDDAGLAGPSRIAITYGQPHARGRQVEGGLVPLDTVWRFGANAATILHSDLDLTVGGLRVPAGDYALFVLNSRAGWYLIVNRGTGQWGTDRDSTRDLGRIPLASRTLREPEETLSVYLVPESPRPTSGLAYLRGALRIKWGTTELSTDWRVD